MKTAEKSVYCPCCGSEKPAYDFPAGGQICTLCAMLSPSAAVLLALETQKRGRLHALHTKAGRKQARIAAKLELYASEGKRCSACHHRKSADAYNKCASASDGLQPICRTCHTIWLAATKSGGRQSWYLIRNAMRAASPEGK